MRSAGGIPREELEQRVRELYPTHTCREIADEIGCSVTPVKQAVHRLELPVRKPAPRRTRPEPEQQLCDCGCGEQARAGGKFVNNEHYLCWKRAQVEAVAAVVQPLWEGGFTLDEIVAQHPEFARHQVWRALRVAGSGERRRGPQPGKVRRRGRLVKCKARDHSFCPHGDTERWVYASQPIAFLSRSCWARYRVAERVETIYPMWLKSPVFRLVTDSMKRSQLLGVAGGTLAALKAKKEGTIGRPELEVPPDVVAEVVRLRDAGWGRAAIAKRLEHRGVTEWVVRKCPPDGTGS